tara:strand:+ start:292 stop:855 length:564 start_codon:yes stop_codon:yes gene_type:complete
MSTSVTIEPRWYIVHTYSGHEERVKNNLEIRVSNLDMGHKIFDVVMPTEKTFEINKDGDRVSVDKRIFPGYIIVNMVMDDESWYVVRNTPGVTGFVSAEDEIEKRPKPVPLEQDEVDRILGHIETQKPTVTSGLQVGDIVKINEGPFSDFMGSIDEVFLERNKVRVLVSFFGRETPVELDFFQVDKA